MNQAFHWDEEAHLWCLSSTWQGNYHESDDQEAESEDDAVRAALEYLLTDQRDTAVLDDLTAAQRADEIAFNDWQRMGADA